MVSPRYSQLIVWYVFGVLGINSPMQCIADIGVPRNRHIPMHDRSVLHHHIRYADVEVAQSVWPSRSGCLRVLYCIGCRPGLSGSVLFWYIRRLPYVCGVVQVFQELWQYARGSRSVPCLPSRRPGPRLRHSAIYGPGTAVIRVDCGRPAGDHDMLLECGPGAGGGQMV